MKVAILGSRGIPAQYGGFETFAENIAIGLANNGCDVSVYCPSYQEFKDPVYKGVRLVFVSNLDNRFKKNRLLRAVANLAYDFLSLVHVTFSDADIVYMLGYASGPSILIPRLRNKTVIVNPDGLEWKSKRWGVGARAWLYFCEMFSAKFAHGLIADAQAIKDHFFRRYKVSTECIPYGAETKVDRLAAPSPYEANGYYLAVARMVPETSIPAIIRGHKKSDTKKPLLVIGPIADHHFFDTEIKPLIDNATVTYLGPIYDRLLLQSYRANASALIHGHASDGTNPSLLESMGYGSPVIAFKRKSNADVLGENRSLYFETDEELASCIQRFEYFSDSERDSLGEINRRNIELNYGWQKATDRHIQYFRKISGI